MTNPKKLRRPNPKNEDELTQKKNLIKKMHIKQTNCVVV